MRRSVSGLALRLAIIAHATAADSGVLRIMPLGDSITQGYQASYRDTLWLALRDAGWNVDFVGSMDRNHGGGSQNRDYDPDHEGHWGWQADEVLQQIARWARNYEPDIVLLHLGTNDVGRGEGPEETAGEVGEIIARLREQNPGVHVLVALIIPVDHSTANERIVAYNRALSAVAAALDRGSSRVIAVDQFTGFDPRQDTYDGIHPNDKGNRKMAARWLAGLEALRSQ